MNHASINSFLHNNVKIIATKNHLTLTIIRGDTSPTAALPAIVLKAQNNERFINNMYDNNHLQMRHLERI